MNPTDSTHVSAAQPDEHPAQWQSRLRNPALPECGEWINISEAGAHSLSARHPDIYEVRALNERGEAMQRFEEKGALGA